MDFFRWLNAHWDGHHAKCQLELANSAIPGSQNSMACVKECPRHPDYAPANIGADHDSREWPTAYLP